MILCIVFKVPLIKIVGFRSHDLNCIYEYVKGNVEETNEKDKIDLPIRLFFSIFQVIFLYLQ